MVGLGIIALYAVIEDVYTNIYAVMSMGIMLAFGLVVSFISLKKHDRLVNEIQQGLEELKEFEE